MSADNNNDLVKKVAFAALLGVGGAVGLYYLLTRNRTSPPKATSSADQKTVDQLKALGNKLFADKKFHEAIEVFTRAIQLEEVGSETTKAMCYQNRAASKEKADGYTTEDCLNDYSKALELNPGYGKAYYRRSLLYHKENKLREALIETFCASSLDPSLEKNAGNLLPLLIEELEKEEHAEFNKKFTPGRPKHVRHERVYSWLHKTVVNDPMKRYVNTKNLGRGIFFDAIRLIQEQKYDEVAAKAAEEKDANFRLEALLIAAKFSAYENKLDELAKYLAEFDEEYGYLVDLEQENKRNFLSTRRIIAIETATSKEEIIKKFYAAIATDIRNVDYYAMAAFRLVIFGEAHEAMKILSTESLEDNNNIKLLRLTLSILANTDGVQDHARLHAAIMELDSFVRNMTEPSPYAKNLLAKVYSTFGQIEPSQQLMDEVLKAEPCESIHYFDRSCMADNAEQALSYLKKCVEIEPYHAEANLMYASLRLNEIGSRLINGKEYREMMGYLDKAIESFDGAPDFPVVSGVFRLQLLLRAKVEAAKRLGVYED